MPLLQIKTSWTPDELFQQAIASVADDTRWLVQTQAERSLVLRRERRPPIWKALLAAAIVVFTLGFGFFVIFFLLPDLRSQQIAITTRTVGGATEGTITYTSGARSRAERIMQMAPRV